MAQLAPCAYMVYLKVAGSIPGQEAFLFPDPHLFGKEQPQPAIIICWGRRGAVALGGGRL